MPIATDVWGSCVKFLKDRYPDWEYVDFEDHADITTLPAKDCLGISGLGATADNGIDTFGISVAVSSYEDKNLFRHRPVAYGLYEFLKKTNQQIPLYDADSAALKGAIVLVDGAVLAPMSKASSRPFQIVTFIAKVVLL